MKSKTRKERSSTKSHWDFWMKNLCKLHQLNVNVAVTQVRVEYQMFNATLASSESYAESYITYPSS